MKFPSEKELKKMREQLSVAEGTEVPPQNELTPVEVIKYFLCERFVKYALEKRMTQTELAQIIGTSQPVINDILKYKLERFTIDRLVNFYSKLNKEIKIIIEDAS